MPSSRPCKPILLLFTAWPSSGPPPTHPSATFAVPMSRRPQPQNHVRAGWWLFATRPFKTFMLPFTLPPDRMLV